MKIESRLFSVDVILHFGAYLYLFYYYFQNPLEIQHCSFLNKLLNVFWGQFQFLRTLISFFLVWLQCTYCRLPNERNGLLNKWQWYIL